MTDSLRPILDSLSADSVATLGDALDSMAQADRLAAVRAMGGKLQKRLYEACEQRGQGAELSFLVPGDVATGGTVIFEGKNSLPLFSLFQKRFTRPDTEEEVLHGYNHQSLSWLTGPGYFVTRIAKGTLLFDYTRVPATAPAGWPEVATNDGGISRLVYKNMHDYCFPVGANTLIGAAYDGPTGKFKGQTFLLTRGQTISA